MKRPSPATVIATLALFFALGGTSIAATQLARNSVGTKQLKDNAVTSTKVKDGSLLAKDFATGQLPQGAKGDTGAQGAKGDAGAPGPAGADALSAADGVRLVAARTLPANGAAVEIIRLEDPITVTRPSRLLAQMTVAMNKPDYDYAKRSRINCAAYVGDGEEPTQLTVPVYHQFDVTTGDYVDGSITTTGSAVVAAGSYQPYVLCVNYGFGGYTGDLWVYGATLDVIAAPAS